MSEMYNMLSAKVLERDWREGQEVISTLANLYEGELPPEYNKYFPTDRPKHVVNLVRLAQDDLATQIGRLPEFRVDPLKNTNQEEKRVSKIEKIAAAHLDNARPYGKAFMWQLGWWLLTGRAVAIVVPDKENKVPRLSIRDPRTCYPGVKEADGNNITELSDLIFKYSLPANAAKEMGLKPRMIEDVYGRVSEATDVEVIEYVDDERWVICSDGGTVISEDHNLGCVPGWVFQPFSPNANWGISQFKDQITFMVAISQLISMKLAQAERLVYPMTWVTGHEGTVKIGPHVLNKLGPGGQMGQLQPPMELQVDRDIELLSSFSRVLNRNPESRQGEVGGSAYVSAKTLETLSESIDTVISRYWDIIGYGLQKLMFVALKMEETLWPNEEKAINLQYKGSRVSEMYIPSEDVAGAYAVKVDYGFGLGGYQGFLQNVQALDAGLQSKRKTLEAMPGVSDVNDQLKEIELEQMDAAGMALFMAQAEQGQLDLVLWSELRDTMANKGLTMSEVIKKYTDMLQEQAQAAMQQGGAEAMTAPPMPEEEMMAAGPQGPPPMPPELMAV